MIVCVFEHVQWKFVINDRLALGYCGRRAGGGAGLCEAAVRGVLGHATGALEGWLVAAGEAAAAATAPGGEAAAEAERLLAEAIALARPPAKIVQGWPKLWANFKALIGIFSQNIGPSLAIWANPVHFSFPRSAHRRPAPRHAVGSRRWRSRWMASRPRRCPTTQCSTARSPTARRAPSCPLGACVPHPRHLTDDLPNNTRNGWANPIIHYRQIVSCIYAILTWTYYLLNLVLSSVQVVRL
jgi:hypothetical protein